MTGRVIPFPTQEQRSAREGVISTVEKTSASRVPRLSMSDAEYARIVRMVDEVAAYWNGGAWRSRPTHPPRGGKPRLVE